MKNFPYNIIFSCLVISSKFYGQDNLSLDSITNTTDLEFSNLDTFTPSDTKITANNDIKPFSAGIENSTNDNDIKPSDFVLFDAVIENNTTLVAELIQKKIDVNFRDESYRTPIMYTTDESIEIVDLLISNGAYINTRDSYGNTILMIASKNGYIELAKHLLEYATLVNAHNREGISALHLAIQNGHTEIVQLLTEHRADIYAPMPNRLSPIFEATQKGYTRIVSILLEKGANPNSKMPKTGTSLLGIASAYGSMSMVQTLISYGATLNSPNKLGITPVFLAAAKGHSEIVEYLLQQDKNITLKTDTGMMIEDVIDVHDRKTRNIIKKYKK